jgi:outer membrane protein TolC
MKRGTLIIVFALAVHTISLRAAELSFAQALKQAGERNASVVVSSKRVQQALARQDQARSFLKPQLSLQASQIRQTRNLAAQGIELPNQDPLVGPFNTFDARALLSFAIYDGTAFRRLKQAANNRTLLEREEALARQDAMALVASLYVEAKRARDTSELARFLVLRDEKISAVVSAQRKTGLATPLQEQNAKNSLLDSHNQLMRALSQQSGIP